MSEGKLDEIVICTWHGSCSTSPPRSAASPANKALQTYRGD
ncbi:hypothetical protein [Candidatus Amarolinea aalborgensis]